MATTKIDAKNLLIALRAVAPAAYAGKVARRPEIAGVHILLDGQTAVVEATDGQRAHRVEFPCSGPVANGRLLGDALKILVKILTKGKESRDVDVVLDSVHDEMYPFPSIREIAPKSAEGGLAFNVRPALLAAALEAASLVSGDRTRVQPIAEDGVAVRVDASDPGTGAQFLAVLLTQRD